MLDATNADGLRHAQFLLERAESLHRTVVLARRSPIRSDCRMLPTGAMWSGCDYASHNVPCGLYRLF